MILAVNGGSSSIKASIYQTDGDERRLLSARIEGIGEPAGSFKVTDGDGKTLTSGEQALPDHAVAVQLLEDVFVNRGMRLGVRGIGHRIVHGGPHFRLPAMITRAMIDELHKVVPFDPLHLPAEIAAAEELGRRYPSLPQVACFDTAFHRTIPDRARVFALPRKLAEEGLVRYGFHGLSYEYILEQLDKEGGSGAGGRLIVAHLGNGASMAAVLDRQCIDTTMGFTPTGGLVMGTRSGDLDPGLLVYLVRQRNMTAEDLRRLLNYEGGLLGISGITSDMKTLVARSPTDPAAALAIEIFCYTARKFIGALSAALGGLDTLVFTGGIGERAADVRARILSGLEYLGVTLDGRRNAAHERRISTDAGRVQVLVVPTNEELMIARHTQRVLDK